MQTRLDAVRRVACFHALLMTVLVQQPRRIQVERIASGSRRELLQTPPPQRPETPQVGPSGSEAREKTRQTRLAGHPPYTQQFWCQRIAPNIGHVRELARFT